MPFCPKCGSEVPIDAKFCVSCGATLGQVSPPPPPPPAGYSPAGALADLGSRIVAGLIDFIIIGIIAAILVFVAFMPAIVGPAWIMGGYGFGWGWFGGMFAVQFLLWLIYFTYFEGTSGQTIGKKFAHIRVVKEDGPRCDFGSALIRSILRIVDSLPTLYILGIILIAATDKRQRLGDMLAKTVVIKA